jgi:hypothetical protein
VHDFLFWQPKAAQMSGFVQWRFALVMVENAILRARMHENPCADLS